MLTPGELWPALVASTRGALECGALHSIPTEHEFVDDGGVNFLVRIIANLERKDRERKTAPVRGSRAANPFLPYDPDMFVADISATHVGLLNKFNVVAHHLLVVTRDFEDQDTLLTPADFEALSLCLAQYPGLGFYNAGLIAGASQPHKHLQVVPLPLGSQGPATPIDPLMAGLKPDSDIVRLAAMPLRHAFVRLPAALWQHPGQSAELILELYTRMCPRVGLTPRPHADGGQTSDPYNLLVTREWMLLVPRAGEFFHTVSLNALAFAGALLVRNAREMALLKQAGPMAALQRVAFTP